MTLSNLRRTFYLDLFSVVQSTAAHQQCRWVSTRSAIHRGIKATQEASKPTRSRGGDRNGKAPWESGRSRPARLRPDRYAIRSGELDVNTSEKDVSRSSQSSSARKYVADWHPKENEKVVVPDLSVMEPDLLRLRHALDDLRTLKLNAGEQTRHQELVGRIRQILTRTHVMGMPKRHWEKLQPGITAALNQSGELQYYFRRRENEFSIRTLEDPRFRVMFERAGARDAGEGQSDQSLRPSHNTTDKQPRTFEARTAESASKSKMSPHFSSSQTERQFVDDDDMPVSIPYTTAASEFLYGSNVVIAALRAKRRKLHHLYLHDRAFGRETNAREMVALAREAGVPVEQATSLRLLDKMSGERPHNGVVLEVSALPAPPVLALSEPNSQASVIPLHLSRQSAEEAAVNGAPSAIPTSSNTWRHPFVVLLDGIVDPGNLGNILRTAHFYGVDAVAVATNTCANLSSATLAKASSGACEAVHLLSLPKPANFVFDSAKAGWRIYAAVAPPTPGRASARDIARSTTTTALAAESPLAKHPCILMLGAEGEGLRENLTVKADCLLSIEHGNKGRETPDVGVDSLNVGVAAGVLMEAFLRKPAESSSRPTGGDHPKAPTGKDRIYDTAASRGVDSGF